MFKFFIIFLSSLSLFCSCQKEVKYISEKSLILGTYQKPTEINPLTTDSSISANLINLIFDPLFVCTSDGALIPNIIENWSTLDDGRVWRFELKRNVLFHDHHLVTASDVKFTYDFLKKKAGGHTSYLNNLIDIKVSDDFHFEFIFNNNDNYFETALCEFGIAPKHLLEGKSDFSEFNKHPIGSGPYKFISQSDQEIVLEKNKSYPENSEIKKITVKIFPNQKAVLNNLIAEKIDMAFLVNPEDYGALDKISSISIYDNWYPMLYMILFNEKEPLFTVNRRQALNMLIDKKNLLERVLKNKGYIAKGTLSPDTEGYPTFSLKDDYNPQKALKILSQEGWADHDHDGYLDLDGKKFEFTTYGIEGEGVAESVLRLIQKQLSEAGIRMDIEMLPFDQYIQHIFREQKFQSNIVYLVFRAHYNNDFSFWHSSQMKEGLNFSHYQNKKVDQILDAIRSELDVDKRTSLNFKLQNELIVSPPGVFLFWRKMPIAVNSRFYNIPEKRMQNLRDIIYFKVH